MIKIKTFLRSLLLLAVLFFAGSDVYSDVATGSGDTDSGDVDSVTPTIPLDNLDSGNSIASGSQADPSSEDSSLATSSGSGGISSGASGAADSSSSTGSGSQTSPSDGSSGANSGNSIASGTTGATAAAGTGTSSGGSTASGITADYSTYSPAPGDSLSKTLQPDGTTKVVVTRSNGTVETYIQPVDNSGSAAISGQGTATTPSPAAVTDGSSSSGGMDMGMLAGIAGAAAIGGAAIGAGITAVAMKLKARSDVTAKAALVEASKQVDSAKLADSTDMSDKHKAAYKKVIDAGAAANASDEAKAAAKQAVHYSSQSMSADQHAAAQNLINLNLEANDPKTTDENKTNAKAAAKLKAEELYAQEVPLHPDHQSVGMKVSAGINSVIKTVSLGKTKINPSLDKALSGVETPTSRAWNAPRAVDPATHYGNMTGLSTEEQSAATSLAAAHAVASDPVSTDEAKAKAAADIKTHAATLYAAGIPLHPDSATTLQKFGQSAAGQVLAKLPFGPPKLKPPAAPAGAAAETVTIPEGERPPSLAEVGKSASLTDVTLEEARAASPTLGARVGAHLSGIASAASAAHTAAGGGLAGKGAALKAGARALFGMAPTPETTATAPAEPPVAARPSAASLAELGGAAAATAPSRLEGLAQGPPATSRLARAGKAIQGVAGALAGAARSVHSAVTTAASTAAGHVAGAARTAGTHVSAAAHGLTGGRVGSPHPSQATAERPETHEMSVGTEDEGEQEPETPKAAPRTSAHRLSGEATREPADEHSARTGHH